MARAGKRLWITPLPKSSWVHALPLSFSFQVLAILAASVPTVWSQSGIRVTPDVTSVRKNPSLMRLTIIMSRFHFKDSWWLTNFLGPSSCLWSVRRAYNENTLLHMQMSLYEKQSIIEFHLFGEQKLIQQHGNIIRKSKFWTSELAVVLTNVTNIIGFLIL